MTPERGWRLRLVPLTQTPTDEPYIQTGLSPRSPGPDGTIIQHLLAMDQPKNAGPVSGVPPTSPAPSENVQRVNEIAGAVHVARWLGWA